MSQYNLSAAHPTMPFILEYTSESSEDIMSAVVYVNYARDKVWFPNNPELDTDEMRRSILATLDTPIFNNEPPTIPKDVLEQIERIKARRGFEGFGHVTV